ncbi:MAG: hypothetical protein NNA20_00215 [Nitrospira sp.]|nr:hypothetical protein [Nitrospira sp.]
MRLGSDFAYSDVFDNGLDVMDPDWAGDQAWNGGIPRRSIIVYRYYEQASRILGSGKTPDIEEFAKGLSQLVLRIRDLVCRNHANEVMLKTFRCYLVAHCMGGLVCRAFLQNPALGKPEARACIDKVFTYATPHNGIDNAGINVPSRLSANDINNFNRKRIAGYLKLEKLYQETQRVDLVAGRGFPFRKVFLHDRNQSRRL